ncbi:Histidinol-phosphate aminotransferase [Paenibacillus sp. JJ-100]|uniref:aminotransferase-like domain-containing protein n=1 Tax=Paenibacillus sp. JJ-100 TaxID=2974896 RepID=UPI0022FFAF70|nr:PLP-dependent aminotransferase family protein [Paenibacillus sp. JJ-100]CAI6085657.1 Histidinol-phosphate aminotransferase [Paenibacillus sp. JJ-100]
MLRKYELIAHALQEWMQEQMMRQNSRHWDEKGIRLPAVRTVAEKYKCSVSTAIRAYEWLEQRHLVYAIPQSGYYAVQNGTGAQDMDWQEPLDFASAAPDPRVFPYADFRHCMDLAMKEKQGELFLYGTQQGLPSLIELLQKQFADYQVFARSEQFFVTTGVQQALAALALMPFPSGKAKVMVELPTYHNMPPLLESLNVPYTGVKRTLGEGLDWESLERQFASGDIKFFYVMPRFHNPIGISMTAAEKKRLLRLAQKYDVYLVEDDYLADLEDNARQDPLWAYDSHNRVIYLKSYSKILFPGLRVGVTVLPAKLVPGFGTIKRMLDIDTSVLSQAALEVYIHSGMFAHHRKIIRNRYASRMEVVREQLAAYPEFAPFRDAPRTGGEHTVLPLEARIPMATLVSRLQKRGILVDTTERYYPRTGEGATRELEKMLRLNISNVPKQRVIEGMMKIREEILRL